MTRLLLPVGLNVLALLLAFVAGCHPVSPVMVIALVSSGAVATLALFKAGSDAYMSGRADGEEGV